MKQILQYLKTGETELVDVPVPKCEAGHVLIETRNSLISTGTERMLVDFGKAGYLEKAGQQPEKVKMVLDKIRTDGFFATVDAVQSKLDQPLQLGYCNAGVIQEVGENVAGFKVGDRVASNGPHADIIKVPQNLCALIPGNVDDVSASFTVLCSVGLQGVRLAGPSFGDVFVVIGLGLVGLVTVQILKANGCRVLGVDFQESRLTLAQKFGAETVDLSKEEDPVSTAMVFSRGRGVDGVLITASTKSNDPVHHAAQMCRKRGRIVLIGVTGLELSRADFYEKELTFQVSCSYGPGRYDANYEQRGQDYPIGYVRWTQQRNFEAILDMMADGNMDVSPLITHRFDLKEARDAYNVLTKDTSALGIVLDYEHSSKDRLSSTTISIKDTPDSIPREGIPVCGFIGAGNYASRILIPAFRKAGVCLDTIVSQGGMSGIVHGRKGGFSYASSDSSSVIENERIDSVVIVTRHDTHAQYVIEALRASKNVFVEKPLAMTAHELDEIENVYYEKNASRRSPLCLMVGFNRRFAPHIIKMKDLLDGVKSPKSFIITVNAGAIPADHWSHDAHKGGGRIIGECCHFVDLLRFLCGSKVLSSGSSLMNSPTSDTVSIQLSFEDGSIGTIHYFANGEKSFPKERIEAFSGGKILQLDNYRKLRGYGWKNFSRMNLLRQDKGQESCVRAYVRSLCQGTPAPIPFEEIIEVSRLIVDLAKGSS